MSNGARLIITSPSMSALRAASAAAAAQRRRRLAEVDENVTLGTSVGDGEGFGYYPLTITTPGRTNALAGLGDMLEGSVVAGDHTGACAASELCPPGDNVGLHYSQKCIGYPNQVDFPTRWTKPAHAHTFAYGSPPNCRPCPPGCKCPGGERCRAFPGFFLQNGENLGDAFGPAQCHPDLTISKERCPPMMSGEPTVCGIGYAGLRCSACASGFFADDTAGGSCMHCPAAADVKLIVLYMGGAFVTITLVAFVIVAVVQLAFGRSPLMGFVRSMRFAGWVVSALATQAQIGRTASSSQPQAIRAYYGYLQVRCCSGWSSDCAALGSPHLVIHPTQQYFPPPYPSADIRGQPRSGTAQRMRRSHRHVEYRHDVLLHRRRPSLRPPRRARHRQSARSRRALLRGKRVCHEQRWRGRRWERANKSALPRRLLLGP